MTNNQEGKKSYASVATRDVFPNKDQAIVIESKEGLTIKDYLNKLATIVDSTNIRFISRIYNNRVCVFLSSKEIADYITDNHSNINIQNHILTVRPLISKQKRIIISNVCPIIPHDVIERELIKRNIQNHSNISFIKAGVTEPGFSHIMSFRRQIFIDPEDINKVPDSMTIFYDNTTYRIYFTSDTMACFNCKQAGHLANQCPTKISTLNAHYVNQELKESHEQESVITQELSQNTLNQKEEHSMVNNKNLPIINKGTLTSESPSQADDDNCTPKTTNNDTSKQCQEQEAMITQEVPQHNLNQIDEQSMVNSSNLPIVNKRSLTSESSSQPDTDNCTSKTTNNDIPKQPIKKKKKTKNDKSENTVTQEDIQIKSIDELIKPIQKIIDEKPEQFPLNYIQFKNFLENSFGAKNPIIIAKDYPCDTQSIIQMMTNTYPLLTERSIKNRFTRIINKLKISNPLNEDSGSDTSTSV